MDGEKGTKTIVYNTKREDEEKEKKGEKDTEKKREQKVEKNTTVKRKNSSLSIILLGHV